MVSLVMRLQMVMVWVLGSWTMKYIMGNLDDRESPSLSDLPPYSLYSPTKQSNNIVYSVCLPLYITT